MQLYNTLQRKKEVFVPQSAPDVSMYVCGVTVYDQCHIGHARAYVVFDCLRRYLSHLGYNVTYVQNFTDIDDKIINRSAQLGEDCQVLTERYIQAYFEDMDALGIQRANIYPKATQHINEMLDLIQSLIDKGVAYEAQGDVCFDVTQYDSYGALSGKILEDLEAGARVDLNQNKRNPLDFVLWKAAKPGEPFWDSPFGKGRPGWHIECSAMAMCHLGHTIDIHGGGQDLVFPHHENEIAQSECGSGKPFANYWVHNGFVTIKDEKMSKSKNNFYTIKELLSQFSGPVLRLYLLQTHYRHPLNFSIEGLAAVNQAYARLQSVVDAGYPLDVVSENTSFESLEASFFTAMDDDLNTAAALGIIFDMVKLINKCQCGTGVLLRLLTLLGISVRPSDLDQSDEVAALIEERRVAKKNKDFQKADAIRDQIRSEFGLLIEDTADGVRCKPVS
ncbi:MAG: cysteine--tRNA ligase [Actinobacteria bacterium]|nr:cysteine--tRNA ligase [Actinomycetota bacterium]|tara:strand:+ start:312 stop:1652 length:1341 start_codon:yes stop_codon:yes gene_type:complete